MRIHFTIQLNLNINKLNFQPLIIMFKYNILIKYNNIAKDKSVLAFRDI